jgi:hypothetical protein
MYAQANVLLKLTLIRGVKFLSMMPARQWLGYSSPSWMAVRGCF